MRRRSILAALCALVAVAALSAYAGAQMAGDPAPVVREALAQDVDPAGAKGRTLGLSRVDVQPGAQLALHRHPGVQIARIDQGVLTYTVVRGGSVTVWRGNPEVKATKVRTIRPGQTAPIRAGQWIVEKPGTIHRARNRGKKKIVIYIATLFRNGEPPAIPVER